MLSKNNVLDKGGRICRYMNVGRIKGAHGGMMR